MIDLPRYTSERCGTCGRGLTWIEIAFGNLFDPVCGRCLKARNTVKQLNDLVARQILSSWSAWEEEACRVSQCEEGPEAGDAVMIAKISEVLELAYAPKVEPQGEWTPEEILAREG